MNEETLFFPSVKKKILKRRQLADEVIAELHEILTSGKYKEGDRFPPESELGEMLNVSRTTIREAVKVLAKTGYLEVQQGRGTFVSRKNPGKEPLEQRLSRASLQEINEVRFFLDIGIAKLAAERRTEEDLAILRKHLDERIEARRCGDLQTCLECDIEFHIAMANASKNRILVDIFTAFSDVLRDFVYRVKKINIPLEYQGILEDHKRLYLAVEAQDADMAVANAQSYLNKIDKKLAGVHESVFNGDNS
jgi:DNA-binding FadR family transcriptional regulator